jgi:hypothetical protein
VKKKKVLIDYLQFLSHPSFDREQKEWFFTYLDSLTEKTRRVTSESKIELYKKYKLLQTEIIQAQKSREIKIETDTVVKKSETKKRSFKGSTPTNANKLITLEMNTKALELKIQGYNMQEIVSELMTTYKIAESTARASVNWCYGELAKDVDEEFIRRTVYAHSEYYDKLYRKLIELDSQKLTLRVLKAKENLNGVGQDIFEIQVNNIFQEQKDIISYGMSKLTEAEQKEFKSIVATIKSVNEQKRVR